MLGGCGLIHGTHQKWKIPKHLVHYLLSVLSFDGVGGTCAFKREDYTMKKTFVEEIQREVSGCGTSGWFCFMTTCMISKNFHQIGRCLCRRSEIKAEVMLIMWLNFPGHCGQKSWGIFRNLSAQSFAVPLIGASLGQGLGVCTVMKNDNLNCTCTHAFFKLNADQRTHNFFSGHFIAKPVLNRLLVLFE